jgi:hypothetical protein
MIKIGLTSLEFSLRGLGMIESNKHIGAKGNIILFEIIPPQRKKYQDLYDNIDR